MKKNFLVEKRESSHAGKLPEAKMFDGTEVEASKRRK